MSRRPVAQSRARDDNRWCQGKLGTIAHRVVAASDEGDATAVTSSSSIARGWMLIVIVVLAGYVIAYPVLVWMLHDLRRFHPHLWTGYGNPHPWRVVLVAGYAVAGWPALVVAWAWRSSQTRRELLSARQRAFDDGRSHHVGNGAP
jgi:hypothetical protein